MAKGKNDKKDNHKPPKVSNKVYEAEMFRLQTELVKLQEWTKGHRCPDRRDLRRP